ncbi:MAG: transglycosylase domain-containing protein [Flavobacteriales bacterium]|nr:transglycosylase domain-containing protein [Flavobacteriales bacterium]
MKYKKYVIAFWTLYFVGILSFVLVMIFISNGYLGKLPTFEDLENPKTNLATQIFTGDGKIMGTYFRENRTNAKYEDISEHVVNALVSTEDERFYTHSGIDPEGVARAVVFLGSKGGASTITQQLAKMLFHKKTRSFYKRVIQKLKEWVIAIRLEKQYTKKEILTMYLNKFDFNYHAVGIKTAAQIYFSKDCKDLDVQEAAMLVGMLKNPTMYNPRRRTELTKNRRNVAMGQMVRNGKLDQAVYDSLKVLDIELLFQSIDHKEGLAPYFREILRAKVTSLLQEEDENGDLIYRKADGTAYNIYRDGLKIYTTLNSKMQKYGEWAVSEHLGKELQNDFFKTMKGKKNAPFDRHLSQREIDNILLSSMRRTSRFRIMSGNECANCGRRGKFLKEKTEGGKKVIMCSADDCGHSSPIYTEDEIIEAFEKPVPMKVFTWSGEIDTTMSPMDSIRYYKSFLQAGFMAMDPHTGYIKAWVGGINKKHFAYDHVAQSKRQVGSTFKPFVYALAIQNNMLPCDEVPNVKTCFDMPDGQPEYCPKNSDGIYGCNVSLKYALANSMNTITAYIMKQFGPQAVVDFAQEAGIKSYLAPVPSLCLGVADLSVMELTGANAMFANKGEWIEPTFITRIEDKNGRPILEVVPEKNEAMDAENAYKMLELMKGVPDGVYNECMGDMGRELRAQGSRTFLGYRMGTGVRIRGAKTKKRPYAGFKYPLAGKTGTTQNNSDGWFIGITPDLVCGTWVGAENRSVHFASTYYGQGANMALPIFGYFMNKVYEDSSIDISREDFEAPNDKIKKELDCLRDEDVDEGPSIEGNVEEPGIFD